MMYRLMLGILLLVLTACSSTGGRLPTPLPPVPPPEPVPAPAPSPPVEPSTPRPPEREDVPMAPLSPSARTLLTQAEAQRERGDLNAATATVERALRLAPAHPQPWLALADIQLTQQRPAEAEAMARRALSLGGATRTVRRQAWTLIARARQMRGDSQGARDAQERADRET
ncbi:tetratricopeptide repeat protein [Candidatus Macondimonas diazotrophica]|uniref:Tetratricopeptide repeat protein n=2 Tax=Candidatus Macondimonas diazotrophica TaxID=2305248 RepID=A0A4Z0F966_9GAMM|nr:tetratricopeptide repeat protein [Candidatus Macondimonas diazotrophica]TFZ82102.1 tetratricopeptide repeat protein [Candidatus Macondimonas diazotrophica]